MLKMALRLLLEHWGEETTKQTHSSNMKEEEVCGWVMEQKTGTKREKWRGRTRKMSKGEGSIQSEEQGEDEADQEDSRWQIQPEEAMNTTSNTERRTWKRKSKVMNKSQTSNVHKKAEEENPQKYIHMIH